MYPFTVSGPFTIPHNLLQLVSGEHLGRAGGCTGENSNRLVGNRLTDVIVVVEIISEKEEEPWRVGLYNIISRFRKVSINTWRMKCGELRSSSRKQAAGGGSVRSAAPQKKKEEAAEEDRGCALGLSVQDGGHRGWVCCTFFWKRFFSPTFCDWINLTNN